MNWRFITKIGILLLPFLCIFLILLDITLKLGDAYPPQVIISQQRANHDLIYLPSWTREDQFFYKFTAATHIQPNVLILGSSRLYQWRTEYMFNDDNIAYNASIGAIEPLEIQWFVEGLIQKDALPDIIIMSIDDPFFNADAIEIRENRVEQVVPPLNYSYQYTIENFRSSARRFILRPNRILDFYNGHESTNYIGAVARDSGNGFRYDGSRLIFNIDEFRIRQIERHEAYYQNNENIFTQGNTIYEPAMEALNNILSLASENDVIVIGLLSPYNSFHFERMIASDEYSYIPQIRAQIQFLFDDYDMPLFDYTSPQSIGSNDEELYDYWHSGEVASLRQYYAMLISRPDIFAAYSDATQIEAYLENVEHPLHLPPITN